MVLNAPLWKVICSNPTRPFTLVDITLAFSGVWGISQPTFPFDPAKGWDGFPCANW